MRIAVCLSGQPRSIEYCAPALKRFFGDTDTNTFDFFCHSWDYNTWKIQDGRINHTDIEYVDKEWLHRQLQRYEPVKYQIDSRDLIYDTDYKHVPWGSLFYSAMMANQFKRLHEAENNFRYDCVVRGRHDIIFHPEYKFDPMPIRDRLLFHPFLERAVYEHSFINASDPYFYGDTWGMDIVSDIFRNILRDYVNMHRKDNVSRLGPGTLMSKYCLERNVDFRYHTKNSYSEVIYRKEMLGKCPVKDYPEILRNHRSYYGQ
jgi:hypothetical protein